MMRVLSRDRTCLSHLAPFFPLSLSLYSRSIAKTGSTLFSIPCFHSDVVRDRRGAKKNKLERVGKTRKRKAKWAKNRREGGSDSKKRREESDIPVRRFLFDPRDVRPRDVDVFLLPEYRQKPFAVDEISEGKVRMCRVGCGGCGGREGGLASVQSSSTDI